jgi:hypothetical protein
MTGLSHEIDLVRSNRAGLARALAPVTEVGRRFTRCGGHRSSGLGGRPRVDRAVGAGRAPGGAARCRRWRRQCHQQQVVVCGCAGRQATGVSAGIPRRSWVKRRSSRSASNLAVAWKPTLVPKPILCRRSVARLNAKFRVPAFVRLDCHWKFRCALITGWRAPRHIWSGL